MKVKLYHCSYRDFTVPSLDKSRSFLDFGRGIYLTEHVEDAISILKGMDGRLYTFELELEGLVKLEFKTGEEWKNYVMFNRLHAIADNYDVVIGKTASGRCSKLFKDMRLNSYKASEAEIDNMLSQNIYKEQYCIKTEKGLSNLKMVGKEYIEFERR